MILASSLAMNLCPWSTIIVSAQPDGNLKTSIGKLKEAALSTGAEIEREVKVEADQGR
jgi:hypothetical protein